MYIAVQKVWNAWYSTMSTRGTLIYEAFFFPQFFVWSGCEKPCPKKSVSRPSLRPSTCLIYRDSLLQTSGLLPCRFLKRLPLLVLLPLGSSSPSQLQTLLVPGKLALTHPPLWQTKTYCMVNLFDFLTYSFNEHLLQLFWESDSGNLENRACPQAALDLV